MMRLSCIWVLLATPLVIGNCLVYSAVGVALIRPAVRSASAVERPQPVALSASPVPDVKLDVELYYPEHQMSVRQQALLQNTTPDVWTEVVFNVPINALPGAFQLETVALNLDGSLSDASRNVSLSENVLRIRLPEGLSPGESAQISMSYQVIIPPLDADSLPPTGNTGWNADLIQAGEWYPALVPYAPGQGWQTWSYVPAGDPTIYPVANYHLSVRVGGGVTVVSGGPRGQDAEGIWQFDVPAGRGIAFLASHRYEAAQGAAGNRPITSYYLPEHREAGQAALLIAQQSAALFEELYGPYPYDSLTIAENGFAGGMEYSALVTLSAGSYDSYESYADEATTLHMLTSHEVAHQWWYGGVGSDQVHEPWIDEGLAFYSQRLYLERYAPAWVDGWWEPRIAQVYDLASPISGSIYEYDTAAFHGATYPHYGYFIHALRGQMGDAAFFAFLRDFYADYAGKLATAQHFRETAQRHTDVDLTPLFDAYLPPVGP